MPRASGPAKPRNGPSPAKAAKPAAKSHPGASRNEGPDGKAVFTTVAVPAPPSEQPPAPSRVEEPVWLVRIVLVLFLVGFAAFLAREVYDFVQALG